MAEVNLDDELDIPRVLPPIPDSSRCIAKTLYICKFTNCQHPSLIFSQMCYTHRKYKVCHHHGCSQIIDLSINYCFRHQLRIPALKECRFLDCDQLVGDMKYCPKHLYKCDYKKCRQQIIISIAGKNLCRNHKHAYCMIQNCRSIKNLTLQDGLYLCPKHAHRT